MPKVIPVIFDGVGKKGDFGWMIRQEKYKDCLFIFNENIEWYYKSFPSKGNACVRNYNQFGNHHPPRSAGIITGRFKTGGFKKLTETSKEYIDMSINEIKELIKKYDYKKIYYSAEDESGKLGTSIFLVGDDVLEYITKKILKLDK